MTEDAGLSFELTAEQRSLRELAHEFAEKEIRPRAAEYDENQTHPADVIEKAHALGLMNLHVPRAVRRTGARPARGRADRRGALLGLRRDRDRAHRATASAPGR